MRNSGETPRKIDLTPKYLGELKGERNVWI